VTPPEDQVRQLVESLGVAHGFERSIKLRHRSVQADRFLLTVAKNTLGPDADARVTALCRSLRISAQFLAEVEKNVGAAEIVHFGFEAETPERSFYKCYLEFQKRAGCADASEPLLLHLAFKWNARDNTEQVIARYMLHPRLGRESILRRIAPIYAREARRTPWDVACTLLSAASRRTPAEELMYLEVEEDGTNRRSFDLNLYRARLTISDLDEFVEPLSRHFGIDATVLRTSLKADRAKPLGHIAGGFDRQERDFLTLYFGVEGRR